MRSKSFLLFLSLIVLAGLQACFPILSEKESGVLVVKDSEVINDCAYKGVVKGTSSFGWKKSQKKERAFNDMRNNAALLGANTVLIISKDSMFEGTVVHGKAYDCPVSGY